MRDLILTIPGKSAQKIQDWALVEAAIQRLDGAHSSRVLLGDDREDYVHMLGKADRLILCIGQKQENAMAYYVLGLSKRNEEEVEIKDQMGKVLVQQNEILASEDALLIARCFWEKEDFPAAYSLREISNKLF